MPFDISDGVLQRVTELVLGCLLDFERFFNLADVVLKGPFEALKCVLELRKPDVAATSRQHRVEDLGAFRREGISDFCVELNGFAQVGLCDLLSFGWIANKAGHCIEDLEALVVIWLGLQGQLIKA